MEYLQTNFWSLWSFYEIDVLFEIWDTPPLVFTLWFLIWNISLWNQQISLHGIYFIRSKLRNRFLLSMEETSLSILSLMKFMNPAVPVEFGRKLIFPKTLVVLAQAPFQSQSPYRWNSIHLRQRRGFHLFGSSGEISPTVWNWVEIE